LEQSQLSLPLRLPLVRSASHGIYGRRAGRDSTKAVKYERLREARELVSIIRRTGDNIGFPECNDACANLRAIVAVIGGEFPHTRRLTEIEWDLDAYGAEQFPTLVRAARDENRWSRAVA
jgi:hypothetical protein